MFPLNYDTLCSLNVTKMSKCLLLNVLNITCLGYANVIIIHEHLILSMQTLWKHYSWMLYAQKNVRRTSN